MKQEKANCFTSNLPAYRIFHFFILWHIVKNNRGENHVAGMLINKGIKMGV